ncbi:hypothetical protein E0H73_42300 [Kribbella pittospori]|uniref:Uncharacterized protein n=1 Tax=Kribbella pittospori TaxID=722689 RepID=A0A4R0JWF7_9ACTN|nr:hypothetical protein [Kribbella pittospori]TCC49578.1 hypothetical protein E0H73_42300 [Kribbella pittospori]
MATGSMLRATAYRPARMLLRRLTALVRRPVVVSTLLLSVAGYGIGPHVEIDCYRLSVAAMVQRDHGRVHTASPATRAADRLADVSPTDQARVEGTLAAAAPVDRPYLLKVWAAGHSADDIVTFARLIRGKGSGWLRTHLSLIDPDGSGSATYRSSPVEQTDDTTCGSMTILVARAMADPLYALHLTTGDSSYRADASASHFQMRLTAEERRIHDATNRFWPQRLGSTPIGLSSELNRHADALGARYEPRFVTGTGGKSALRDAVEAAGNGQPVPVLIGNWIPRHYILLIGRDGGDLVIYEPGYATVDRISAQSFLDGKIDVIGYRHLYSVVTPTA